MTTSVPQRVAYIVGIGAVLGASSSIAKRGVPSWESTVFRGINRQPDALQYLAWVPMQAGALAAPLVLGAITAIKGDRRRGLTVAVAGLAAWGSAKAAKAATRRGRPKAHDENVRLRIGAADAGLGFPSGHAAVAATIAAALPAGQGSDAYIALGALAIAVGWTRIYIGAHYPLDVVGGWALGLLVADATKAVLS